MLLITFQHQNVKIFKILMKHKISIQTIITFLATCYKTENKYEKTIIGKLKNYIVKKLKLFTKKERKRKAQVDERNK